MAQKQSKRQAILEKRRRKAMTRRVVFGAISLAALALLGFMVWNGRAQQQQQPMGEAVAVMPDSSHVEAATDPGPYNSDPPTSGRHYEDPATAGFFNASDIPGPHPEGHLVHNLEHGYIIFWYNCSQLDEQACNSLKDQIRGVMEQENYWKVIAYPWQSTDVPVVLTSWGRMFKMEEFDPAQARAFVQQNRNKAPEPNAP